MSTQSSHDQFVPLLREHWRLVRHIAGAYAASAEDRDDLAQEIAGHLWSAFPSFDRARRFSTWAYRVALNVAISHARRIGRRGDRPTSLGMETDLIADPRGGVRDPDDRVEALTRLIAGLDEIERALLLLHLDDRSGREIADVLGISETNVSTKLHRIKKRLRRDVADQVS